jgi:Mg-chelatase subunit ChlD
MHAELICIVDRSGSMQSMKTDAEGGFNAMIEQQRKLEGTLNVTLVTFDDRVETIYQGLPVAQVPPLVIDPRGSTALLDAICTTLYKQNERIKADAKSDKTIVAIVTDGQENSSKEHNLEAVRKAIALAEEAGWEFIYLGANQDAFSVGQSFGLSARSQQNTQTYDSHSSASVRGMTDHLGSTVTNLRATPAARDAGKQGN